MTKTAPVPRVFRMARWVQAAATISCLLVGAAGGYFATFGESMLVRVGGAAGIAFALAAFLDVLVSRVVLDTESIRIISLVRARSHARSEFESVKVDGGAVCLKKRDGGWVILPSTGHDALSVRNTIDAWIKSQ